MKKVALLSLFALVFGAFAFASCPVESGYTCQFYSGDLNLSDPNQNGLANENDAIVSGSPYGAATFQNFNWAGGTVTGLATNNLSGLNPTTAYWEIRSGVSEGNGGTLVASGTGSTSNQATGRSDFGFIEYTNFVGGLSVNLGAGQYWMSVVPQDVNNANRSFNSDTDGTNGIGSYQANNQYFDSAFFGANFTNANSQGAFAAFSQAAYGTVPEPSSLIMLGSGLVAAAGVVRRRLGR
jgi:hypothetical protein